MKKRKLVSFVRSKGKVGKMELGRRGRGAKK